SGGSSGSSGRHPLPDPAVFQAAMRAAGVSPGRAVVVYDDADSMAAARAWWVLRYFGHPAVQVLDGGFLAWTAAGQPVSTAEPTQAAGMLIAVPGGMPTLDAVTAARLARSGVLLDARAGERYRGEQEPVDPVAGHIPGGVSAPASGNVTPDGRFLPAAELRARFARLGVPGTDTAARAAGASEAAPRPGGVGAYCGSGVTAAHEVLALTLAGIPASLYVDSWSGWVADRSRPVATGPDPG
ncbi:MAG: sulfurtransferase, partial [Streptosporangiaceae bacterium]